MLDTQDQHQALQNDQHQTIKFLHQENMHNNHQQNTLDTFLEQLREINLAENN